MSAEIHTDLPIGNVPRHDEVSGSSMMHPDIRHAAADGEYVGTIVIEYVGTIVIEYMSTIVIKYMGTIVIEYMCTIVIEYMGTIVIEYMGTIVIEPRARCSRG